VTAIRYEIWTRQESGTFERKFPLRGEIAASFTTDLFGRATLTLPVNHPRLDDILFVDQSDRTNDTASVIRAYIGTDPIFDFYAESVELNFTDTGARVATVGGSARGTCFDRVRVRQFDWNASPSIQPDHLYGIGSNELDRSALDVKLSWNFDDDNADGWGPATAVSGVNPLEGDANPEISTDEALSGTKSLKFNPNAVNNAEHSGVEKTVSVDPSGQRATVDISIKSNTVSRRFTAYIIPDDGSGTHHSTNGYTFNGIYFVELDNVPRAAARDGNPGGTTDGTWQTFALDATLPAGQDRMTFGVISDHHALPDNGPIAYLDNVVVAGNGLGLSKSDSRGWMSYGTFTDWLLSTHPTTSNPAIEHTGTGVDVTGSGQFVDVEPGRTYSFSVDVYHTAGVDRNFRTRIRTGDSTAEGTILGSTDTAVVTATNTTLTETMLIPDGVTRVAVDVLLVNLVTDTWYLDLETVAFYAGNPPGFTGKILNDMLDDAGVDHSGDNRTALVWLARTFSDTLDSAGVAWDEEVEMRIRRGVTYRSIIEQFENMGYEFSIDVNPADETEWRFNAYNPDGMGTDHSAADGPAILSRPGVLSVGPFLRREPIATYAMVEGDELEWAEYRDTNMEAAWGELETYFGSQDSLKGSLLKQATEIIVSDPSESLIFSFAGHLLTPVINYDIGDLVRVSIGESIYPSAVFRVAAISVRDSEIEPQFQVEFQPV